MASETDAIVCTLPSNVLLLSGYWPVVGTSVAIATRKREAAVIIPEDEVQLARTGWITDITPYTPGSLDSLEGPRETIVPALAGVLHRLNLDSSIVAIEIGSIYEEASYSAAYRFQAVIGTVMRKAARHVRLTSADEVIRELRYTLTAPELNHVRVGCALTAKAFEAARETVTPGRREPEVAAAVSRTFELIGLASPDVRRCGAFAWCMSGPSSARAGGAYAITGNRELGLGELVLVHANPYVDGYFGDVTRTYVLGAPNGQIRAMYDAVFAAREAGLAAIRPGASASTVDRAAREVIERAGYGQNFTHGLGHSVGFSAISADFAPRLHPASPDILEVGCTVNVEPAIYIEGVGGVRHCDVVTVTAGGFELLTPFHERLVDCIIDA